MGKYLDRIIENLRAIDAEEAEAISRAADAVADVIVRDGIVYVFGCGHSHLPAMDAFYRAGGLANVSPILDVDLMLHDGAAKSSRMEKMPGLAAEVFRRYRVTPNDMLVVISATGKN
ncbi:MAG: SIS domain-containing protein, partial [Kiritimatiellae bacterium]|nr:SIS domain-containing protein [Kiritimatiellia bacterium]